MVGVLTFFLVIFILWYLFINKLSPHTKKEPTALPPISYPKFIVLSLGLLVLAFNLFLYGTFSPLSFTVLGFGLFNLAWLAVFVLSLPQAKRQPLIFFLAALSALTGVATFLRANGFVQSVNTFLVIGTNLFLIFLLAQEQITWKISWLSKHLFKMIPLTFYQFVRFLKKPQAQNNKNVIITIFKTTAITLVVVIFFVKLLSSADPVFAEIIRDYQEQIIGRTLTSLFLAFVTLILLTLRSKADPQDTWKFNFLSFAEIMVPVVAMVGLFAVFLGVQINYLFGSHADLAAFNLTYSEYVRKGFTELLVTALAGGLIAYLVILKSRSLKKISHLHQLQWVNTALILELFAMLASAFKRDIMYVETYGLTRVRIVGGLFLTWLAILLASLLVLTLVKKIKEKYLFLSILASSVLVIAGLNLFNIDKYVAAASPAHHDYKDYFYINNLSEDGWRGWQESIPAIASDVAQLTRQANLTDIQKYRLAGDKLALISLQEKRLKLFIKYADEEWLRNYCQAHDCQNKVFEIEYMRVRQEGRSLTVDPNQTETPIEERNLRDMVINARKWQHYNRSEKEAYVAIRENKVMFVDQVDSLLDQIVSYQEQQGLSLFEEENKLLNEFSYPFINISLDYYPHQEIDLQAPPVPVKYLDN